MASPTQGKDVRVRFAPSPTGYLHVGGARTALFNYLFARSVGGTFVLRIEDTDLARSTPEAVAAIFDGLQWLNINPDEGPYFQTKRFELYRSYATRLLQSGHAYPCFATAEELEALREAQRARNEKPRYDGRYRPATLQPQATDLPDKSAARPFVIRFRAPQEGDTVFDDMVLGPVATPNSELEDLVIVRSDGTPTYNFVVVVDDIDMKISHVIRGSDHVSNTPKQVALYQAFLAPLPCFAHVPMILGPDKKKLSKRHGATSVVDYRKDGYLADGFVNYLVRLGWSHGDQEIFTRGELEKIFSLEHIGKSPAVFDTAKLRWVNAEHLKTAPYEIIFAEVQLFLKEFGLWQEQLASDQGLKQLIESLRERVHTLREMAEACRWYLCPDDHVPIAEKEQKKHLTSQARSPITALISKLSQLTVFDAQTVEESFQTILTENQIGMGKLGPPVRIALTGTMASPPLFDIFIMLGKERCLSRLGKALELIP